MKEAKKIIIELKEDRINIHLMHVNRPEVAYAAACLLEKAVQTKEDLKKEEIK